MAAALVYALALSTCLAHVLSAPAPNAGDQSFQVDLFMDSVQPKRPDQYLCTSFKVGEAHIYLTGFKAKADSHVAHHILLYGCTEPGQLPGEAWNCGEMSEKAADSSWKKANVCKYGFSILYAWAMDAPKLSLPEGVGFDVGQETSTQYLVLQVHYKNVTTFLPPFDHKDSSGVTLQVTPVPTPKMAGVYLMWTAGQIPAHSIEYFETACSFEEDEITLFAYRTHAHSFGRLISGYRVRDGNWTEIGRKDPRKPEMFYPVTTPGMKIKKGDILAARCTMENSKDHTVYIGNTQNDEMCNFYVMYYVDKPPTLHNDQCASAGPPHYYWRDFEGPIHIENVPKDASLIPGTTKPLKRNATYALGEEEDDSDDKGADSEKIVPGMPGQFQDGNGEQITSEALQEMTPDELLFLVQQIEEEEEEAEERERMWRQRQLMRQSRFFPYKTQY